jgi:hypothetical protein
LTGQITLTSPLTAMPALGDTIAVGGTLNSISKLNHAFDISPFGNDIAAEFGDEQALPIVGNFDPPAAPTVVSPSTVQGDYDGSGYVDNADKAVFRATFGSTTNLLADGSHSGQVDAADYVLWRKKVGSSAGAGSGPGAGMGESFAPASGSSEAYVQPAYTTESVSASTLEVSSTAEGASLANPWAAGTVTTSGMPKQESPTIGPTVFDLAFNDSDAESSQKAFEANTVIGEAVSNGDLLLLSIADYSPTAEVSSLRDSLDDDATDSDAVDVALDDFAVGVLI